MENRRIGDVVTSVPCKTTNCAAKLAALVTVGLLPSVAWSQNSSISKFDVVRDVGYAEPKNARQSLDVYFSASLQNAPTIIWIHGGGWRRGDKGGMETKAATFFEQGYVFVSTTYRFFPEVSIKEMTGDVAKSIRWVRDNIRRYGGDPQRLADYDLWPDKQFPGQAAKYRSDDRRALKLAASLYHFRRVGDADGALESESQLNSLRSFQEEQKHSGEARRHLITSKWAERINDRWYVVVVYSDVTQQMEDLAAFQQYAFHCLKTDLGITSSARYELELLKSKKGGDVNKAYDDLAIGLRRLSFHAEHLGKFSLGQIDRKDFQLVNLSQLLREECEVVARVNASTILVTCDVQSECSTASILGNLVVLQAVVQELLRNAEKQIRNRAAGVRTGDKIVDFNGSEIAIPPFCIEKGYINVSLQREPGDHPNPGGYFRLSFSDNGIAACSKDHYEQFGKALRSNFAVSLREKLQRGVAFIQWAVSKHDGFVRLAPLEVHSVRCGEEKRLDERVVTVYARIPCKQT